MDGAGARDSPELSSGCLPTKADWEHQPWVKLVGADTTKVRLAFQMENTACNHITVGVIGPRKSLIDLGFAAAVGRQKLNNAIGVVRR